MYRFESLKCPKCNKTFNSDKDRIPVDQTYCHGLSCLICTAQACACQFACHRDDCQRAVDDWVDALTKMDKLQLSEDKNAYETNSPCEIVIPPFGDYGGQRLKMRTDFENELVRFRAAYLEKEAANLKKDYLEKCTELEWCRISTINCSGCQLEFALDELFKCKSCKTTVCQPCLTKEHGGHETVATKPKDKSQFLLLKTTKRFDALVAGNERNIRVLNTEIGEKMKEFQAAAQTTLNRMTLEPERSVELAHQVNEAADEFERICEKAYPVTRKMNDDFDTLLTQFAKICRKAEDAET